MKFKTQQCRCWPVLNIPPFEFLNLFRISCFEFLAYPLLCGSNRGADAAPLAG
jgi:hypothetical protein